MELLLSYTKPSIYFWWKLDRKNNCNSNDIYTQIFNNNNDSDKNETNFVLTFHYELIQMEIIILLCFVVLGVLFEL